MRTKTAAVDLALRHLAGQPMTREEALAMRGARAIGEAPADVRRVPLRDPRRHIGPGRGGARDDRRESELRRLLLRFELLHFDVWPTSTARCGSIVAVVRRVNPSPPL